ncbi:glycosyltransferase family 4 protein [Sulfurimonas sp.]
MKKIVIHQISLTGIGGVQQSFIPYFKLALKNSAFKHKIFGLHNIDIEYEELEKYYTNINNSFLYKLKLIYYIWSKNYIIHFYNNLGSKKIEKILRLIPSSNIIFHERGTVWNANSRDSNIYINNALKAKLILANSNASKIILTQKFSIDENKINVVYNGFLSKADEFVSRNIDRYSSKFSVGYIGRLDTPKGVHTLIHSAKKLKEYEFFIAGDGTWKNILVDLAKDYENIKFLGRIKEPLEFINKMDIIVVPSIREPLGNSIIEAGFCKKAVIASNVDGIPEIIENNKSGALLEMKNEISIKELPIGSVPLPELVVDPMKKELMRPKEICIEELSNSIVKLEKNKQQRYSFGNNLYNSVKNKFSIEDYFEKLEKIYKSCDEK